MDNFILKHQPAAESENVDTPVAADPQQDACAWTEKATQEFIEDLAERIELNTFVYSTWTLDWMLYKFDEGDGIPEEDTRAAIFKLVAEGKLELYGGDGEIHVGLNGAPRHPSCRRSR